MAPAPLQDAAPAALDLDESVRLGYAVIDDLAVRHDVRCLAIKGPVLAAQGLREVRASVDIDVLVDPAGFARFVEILAELGWVDQGPFDIPSVMRRHSVTLRHPAWSCELDVHRYYPGFLADDEHTFEVLWQRRVEVRLAGRSLATCDPVGHGALAALHYLRDHAHRVADLDRLVAVVRDGWPQERLDALVDLAREVGAERTLEPFLTAIGRPVRHLTGPDPAFEEWALRSQARTQVGLGWLVELRRTPWWRRPAVLRRAAWLSESDLRLAHTDLGEGWRPLARARLARLRRGLSALPTVARDVRSRDGGVRTKPPRLLSVRASAGRRTTQGMREVGMDNLEARHPTVAIAHDYLTQRGGAERVVLSMARAFPDAPIYTTLYDPEGTFAAFADLDVRTSPLNRVGPLRRHHRAALPLLPWASGRIRIDADVVLCSSSGWAHGFSATGKKLVYCHAPARWLYQGNVYLGSHSGIASLALKIARRPLLKWDRRSAASASGYLANSRVVQTRIAEAYGIQGSVLHAPVAAEFRQAESQPVSAARAFAEEGFFLCVSRLLPYKNIDVICEAFRARGQGLIIVGSGPERQRLQDLAPSGISFIENLTDGEMKWLYENCHALVAASHEDFGLSPLEAAMCGKPSVVLRAGGFLDTMDDDTAVFFDELSPAAVTAALDTSLARDWDAGAIRDRASLFNEKAFIDQLRKYVARMIPATQPIEAG